MSAQDIYAMLAEALRQLFPENDVELVPTQTRGHAPAARADIVSDTSDLQFWIELLINPSRANLIDAVTLLQSTHSDDCIRIPMLAAPYLSPAKQSMLRDTQTAFLDFAGNAWIVTPGVHIDRRGFENPEREPREQRDPFSDKASLVLRTLLRAPSPIGVRQIADIVDSTGEANLSPGYVSKVVQELERRGYAARRDERIVLRHGRELLEEWVIAYRKRTHIASREYFIPSPSAESLMPGIAEAFDGEGIGYVFAGQAGASVVDRHASFDVVDVYVRGLEDADLALAAIGAHQVDRGGNVRVSLPYYRESAFYDQQAPGGAMKVASDVQLYLDLYDYPIRGREQAEHLYERRLRPLVERDDAL